MEAGEQDEFNVPKNLLATGAGAVLAPGAVAAIDKGVPA